MSRVGILAGVFALAMGAAVSGQSPPVSDPQRQQALALEQQGKSEQAQAAWRAYVEAHPKSPEAYAHLGLLEARLGHFKEAVPLYRKALALGPDVPGLRLNLGLALFKGGDPEGALHEFEPLLKAQPGNLQLTTLIGMAHYAQAQYAEAVPYLRDAAAQDTQSISLRLALAHSCLWSKQSQCVLDVYKEILALNPDSAEADMLAGEALDEEKDNEGSTKMFRAAAKADPKFPNVHFGLGYLLWTQKQYKEAASEFHAELANDPDHIQAQLYLADTDIQTNQMSDAVPLLERVEKQNASIPLDHLDLGIAYTELDRKEDALRELKAAEKLNPNEVNVHWRLARLYRALGKGDEAKAEFAKAGKLNQAADEDLYKKIANGKQRSPEGQEPQTTPPQ